MVAFSKNQNQAVVSNEEFVRVNVEASLNHHGTAWIADKLNVSESTVSARRTKLKSEGVVLPDLDRGRVAQAVDADSLNSLIQQMTKPEATTRGRGRRPAGNLAS